MSGNKNLYVECQCHNSDHLVILTHDPDEDYPETWFSVALNQHFSFWKRIAIAVKYVLKKDSSCGHYDVTDVSVEKLKEVKSFIEDSIASHEAIEAAKATRPKEPSTYDEYLFQLAKLSYETRTNLMFPGYNQGTAIAPVLGVGSVCKWEDLTKELQQYEIDTVRALLAKRQTIWESVR